jgi:peptide/nickel transport system substrate-binding protein
VAQSGDTLDRIINDLTTGRLSRRAFLARTAALGLTLPTASALLAACGGTATNAPGSGGATSAPASAGATTAPTGLDTLVVAVQEGDTRTLDPQSANELTVPMFLKVLYDQIVTFPGSEFDRVVPAVAKDWTISPDGLTYTFNIAPGINFSDGSTLTADDVIFSVQRHKNYKGNTSWFQDSVEGWQKTGDMQVTMKLNTMNVDILNILTSPFVSIGNAKLMKANGATDAVGADKTDTAQQWLDLNSVGSGPFVLDAWAHGTSITMHRNPYYWGTKPPFEKVVFQFVADQKVQKDLLVRGDAHIAVNMTPDLAASLEGDPNIGVLTIPSLGFAWLGMHVSNNPAFANPKNWEAVKLAIDYDGMAQIYKGGGQFVGGVIPPGVTNALPVGERVKQDINGAKAALQAAGNPNGFSFVLTYAQDNLYGNVASTDIAQKVAADLQAIGIQANLRPLPATQESTEFRAGKLEAALHYWGADYLGWTDFLPVFGPGGHVGGPRHGWYPEFSPESKEIADMAAEAMRTLDAAHQNELCLAAQRKMNGYSPEAYLFMSNYQVAIRKDIIKSIQTNPVWFVDVGTTELV